MRCAPWPCPRHRTAPRTAPRDQDPLTCFLVAEPAEGCLVEPASCPTVREGGGRGRKSGGCLSANGISAQLRPVPAASRVARARAALGVSVLAPRRPGWRPAARPGAAPLAGARSTLSPRFLLQKSR